MSQWAEGDIDPDIVTARAYRSITAPGDHKVKSIKGHITLLDTDQYGFALGWYWIFKNLDKLMAKVWTLLSFLFTPEQLLCVFIRKTCLGLKSSKLPKQVPKHRSTSVFYQPKNINNGNFIIRKTWNSQLPSYIQSCTCIWVSFGSNYR